MPPLTASRAGSSPQSGAADGCCCPGCAATRHWLPLPEPLAGGTSTLQEILHTVCKLMGLESLMGLMGLESMGLESHQTSSNQTS